MCLFLCAALLIAVREFPRIPGPHISTKNRSTNCTNYQTSLRNFGATSGRHELAQTIFFGCGSVSCKKKTPHIRHCILRNEVKNVKLNEKDQISEGDKALLVIGEHPVQDVKPAFTKSGQYIRRRKAWIIYNDRQAC